jgi:hypothetical protein
MIFASDWASLPRAAIPNPQPNKERIMAQNNQSKPTKVFRYRGISASVFENTTHDDKHQPVRFFKVSLQRAFKRDGKFEHNSSFGRDDIPVARHVLDQAWQFILECEAAATAETNQE